jgi:hypothetical protein
LLVGVERTIRPAVCGALMRSGGGCVGVGALEGTGAPVNAPQDIAKECAEQFKLIQARPRLVHLLPVRRRLSLQPLDRVQPRQLAACSTGTP